MGAKHTVALRREPLLSLCLYIYIQQVEKKTFLKEIIKVE